MSILDPESLMFSVDWKSLEEAFIRRANAVGYHGLAVYNYSETIEMPSSPKHKVFIDSAKALGAAAADSINKLIVE